MTTKEELQRFSTIHYQNKIGKIVVADVQTSDQLREFMEEPEFADHANQLPMTDLYAICQLAPSLSLEEIDEIRSCYPSPLLYSQVVYLEALMDKRLKAAPAGYKRVIGSVGHLKQGYTKAYGLTYKHKGIDVVVEFPEVMIHNDDSSYVTRMKRADAAEVEKELLVSLSYCYRYAIPTNRVMAAAGQRTTIKEKRLKKIIEKAEDWSKTVKTIDEELIKWAEAALKYCNSINQTNIVVEIYSEACRFANSQPVICKKRIAERAGVDRKVVRRLVERLEKAGAVSQSPENFRITDGQSDARILNLGKQPDRWEGQKFLTPDRSAQHLADRRAHQAKLDRLLQRQRPIPTLIEKHRAPETAGEGKDMGSNVQKPTAGNMNNFREQWRELLLDQIALDITKKEPYAIKYKLEKYADCLILPTEFEAELQQLGINTGNYKEINETLCSDTKSEMKEAV